MKLPYVKLAVVLDVNRVHEDALDVASEFQRCRRAVDASLVLLVDVYLALRGQHLLSISAP